jgi:hypothetical protein
MMKDFQSLDFDVSLYILQKITTLQASTPSCWIKHEMVEIVMKMVIIMILPIV